jgi:hypothetical protein
MVFDYKGEKYKVINELKMKHPTTREWVDAFLYTPIQRTLDLEELETPQLYVREKSEFLERFKKIK